MQNAEVIVPIVIAVGSGLAFLAYRQRAFFEWVSGGLSVAVMLTLLVTMIWNTAAQSMWSTMYRLLEADDLERGRAALDEVQFPAGVVFICAIGIWLYLLFLRAMPHESAPRERQIKDTDEQSRS